MPHVNVLFLFPNRVLRSKIGLLSPLSLKSCWANSDLFSSRLDHFAYFCWSSSHFGSFWCDIFDHQMVRLVPGRHLTAIATSSTEEHLPNEGNSSSGHDNWLLVPAAWPWAMGRNDDTWTLSHQRNGIIIVKVDQYISWASGIPILTLPHNDGLSTANGGGSVEPKFNMPVLKRVSFRVEWNCTIPYSTMFIYVVFGLPATWRQFWFHRVLLWRPTRKPSCEPWTHSRNSQPERVQQKSPICVCDSWDRSALSMCRENWSHFFCGWKKDLRATAHCIASKYIHSLSLYRNICSLFSIIWTCMYICMKIYVSYFAFAMNIYIYIGFQYIHTYVCMYVYILIYTHIIFILQSLHIYIYMYLFMSKCKAFGLIYDCAI